MAEFIGIRRIPVVVVINQDGVSYRYAYQQTEEERAGAQRWALELSPIADPEARQAALATAPAHWQPTIRHDLAWRVGMAAWRATLRTTEPATGEKPTAGESI